MTDNRHGSDAEKRDSRRAAWKAVLAGVAVVILGMLGPALAVAASQLVK